jgi:hypothetical protein
MAGPPGFEPGTLPQERNQAVFFSGGFPGIRTPEGKSIIDILDVTDALPFQDPDVNGSD